MTDKRGKKKCPVCGAKYEDHEEPGFCEVNGLLLPEETVRAVAS